MRVYVVTEGYRADYHIEAIFTSRRNAEQYVTNHTNPQDKMERRMRYKIEEYETDTVEKLNETRS